MPKKKKELEYSIGQWRGHPHYQCKSCPFDTLSKSVIEDHVVMHQVISQTPVKPVDSVQDPEQTGDADMFELELEEVEGFTDDAGIEHKKFTVKE